MTSNNLPYIVPYILSLSISLFVGWYAWRRRARSGALTFAIVALGEAFWTFGYIFELTDDTLDGKLFWDGIQWIPAALLPIAIFELALQFIGRKHSPRLWLWLSLIPFIFLGLVATNAWHGWVLDDAHLIEGEQFSILTYSYGWAAWALAFYLYALTLGALYLLIIHFIQAQPLYRFQIGLFVLGCLAPIVGGVTALLDIQLLHGRDISPFTFTIANLLFMVGLFNFRLFDLVPVARTLVFENLPDVIIVLDEQERVLDVNPATQRILQQPMSKIIGQPAFQVFAEWGETIKQWRGFEGHTEITLGEGENTRYLDLNVIPLQRGIASNRGKLVMVRDITAHEQARRAAHEKELLAIRLQKERELNALKSKFIEMVSHEFRTPLSIISTNASMLEKYLSRMDDAAKQKRIDHIYHAINEVVRIIDKAILVDRLNSGAYEVQNTSFSLREACQEAIQRLPDEQGRIELVTNHHPYTCFRDRDAILWILTELLTNALKFSPNGTSIQVKLEQSDNALSIKVIDHGIGIPPDDRAHLFAPFYRAKNVGSTRGIGLGLTIVQQYAALINGQVTCESAGLNHGATFSLVLSAAEDKASHFRDKRE